jgi:hypothetical protein
MEEMTVAELNVIKRLLADEWEDTDRDRQKAQAGSRREIALLAYQNQIENMQAKLGRFFQDHGLTKS